jgi:hypothetical protein
MIVVFNELSDGNNKVQVNMAIKIMVPASTGWDLGIFRKSISQFFEKPARLEIILHYLR